MKSSRIEKLKIKIDQYKENNLAKALLALGISAITKAPITGNSINVNNIVSDRICPNGFEPIIICLENKCFIH